MNGDVEFWSQLTSDLTGGLTPEQLAQQQLEEAGGAAGAAKMGALEGFVPVVGKQVREMIQGPQLREQQRADYPLVTAISEFVGGIPAGLGTAKLASKLAGPTASMARQALTSAGIEAGVGGATAAAKGGDIMDVALSTLLSGTLGGAGGAAQARGAAGVKSAAQEALAENPKYLEQLKQTNTLFNNLVKSEKKLARVEADLASEKIGLRNAAKENLDTLKSNLEKSQKNLDALRVKMEKAPPVDKTSPEYQAWQQRSEDVKRLQKQYDSMQNKIRELEATAPTKLGAERERSIAAARRDVVKAEERVFSAEEKAELDDALLKIMRQREGEVAAAGKVKAKNERIKREQAKKEAEAAPVEETAALAPAEEPIPEFGRAKDLTPRQIELLEDLVASGKSLRDIGSEVPGGMNKDTLNRRLKKYGITPESAKENAAKRAAQKAELEAAAQDIVPEPAPTPAAPEAQLEKVPKVSRDILSAADKRKLQQEEVLGPIRQKAELGRYGRAQERLGAAEAAPVPTLAESRFLPEHQIRQEQLGTIGDELSKAVQMREEALAALQRAQPGAQPALLQQYENAQQAIGRKAQEYDDALKALEEEIFMVAAKKEPFVAAERAITAADKQRYQEAQALVAQMENVSPGMIDQLFKILGPAAIVKTFSVPGISELTDEDVKAVLTNQ